MNNSNKKGNLFWKIISLFIAICLWYFVIQVQNPNDLYTINQVKINVINQEKLTEKNLCLSNIEKQNLNVTLTGKKVILGQIRNYENQISGVVDMQDYLDGNTIAKDDEVYLPLKVVLPDFLKNLATVEKQSISYIKINVDEIDKKVLDVSVNVKSNLDDQYLFDSQSIKILPQKVEISGPKNLVDNVTQLIADVNITSNKNEIYDVNLKAFDANEHIINDVSISPSNVQVNVPILIQKKVKLSPNILKTLDKGYELEELKIEPSEIYLATKQGDYSSINDSLSIPITIEQVEGTHQIEQKLQIDEKYFNVKNVKDVKITYKIKNVNY